MCKYSLLVTDECHKAGIMLVHYSQCVLPICILYLSMHRCSLELCKIVYPCEGVSEIQSINRSAFCAGGTDEDRFWLMQSPIVWHALSSMAYKPLLDLLLQIS